jgi:hypothetical protein
VPLHLTAPQWGAASRLLQHAAGRVWCLWAWPPLQRALQGWALAAQPLAVLGACLGHRRRQT